jgi:oligopeptide/dipeptide ABC transporter ATP-binding protein
MADDVVVMYGGKVVEYTDCLSLYKNPRHPYSIGLFGSLPSIGHEKESLMAIPGMVPNPLDFPSGCRFRPRCAFAQDQCKMNPLLENIEVNHQVACWRTKEVPSLVQGSKK